MRHIGVIEEPLLPPPALELKPVDVLAGSVEFGGELVDDWFADLTPLLLQ